MPEEIVTVTKCISIPEAEACRLGLEAEGLTVYLTDAETIRTDWLLSNAIGDIKVQVPVSQSERATELLQEIRQRHEEQSKRTEDFCLACGTVMPEEASECTACGWSYGTADDEESSADQSDKEE